MSTPPALTVTTPPASSAASETVGQAPSSSLTDWALLVTPGLIWGCSFLFIAEGLDALVSEVLREPAQREAGPVDGRFADDAF